MGITGILSAFDLGSKVIDKLGKYFPSQAEKDAAKLELLKMQQAGEFKELDSVVEMARMQAAVNQEEAKNPNIFVAGWRPAVGWVCAFALFAQFIGAPALDWFSAVIEIPPPPNPPDWTQLTPVLLGMLGLGWMRTYEKKNGLI